MRTWVLIFLAAAFDVTPSALVTSYILDTGNLSLSEFLQEKALVKGQ